MCFLRLWGCDFGAKLTIEFKLAQFYRYVVQSQGANRLKASCMDRFNLLCMFIVALNLQMLQCFLSL